MELTNQKWYCIRHMCEKLHAIMYIDEAGTRHYEASCRRCLDEQDRLKEELEMYHNMDARIRDLQNAIITVLSPE